MTGVDSGHVVVVPVLVVSQGSVPASATPAPGGDSLPNTGVGGLAISLTLGLLFLASGVTILARSKKRYMPKRA